MVRVGQHDRVRPSCQHVTMQSMIENHGARAIEQQLEQARRLHARKRALCCAVLPCSWRELPLFDTPEMALPGGASGAAGGS